jgi:hypothetical protein
MFVEINYVSSMSADKDDCIAELLEVAVYVLLKKNPVTHQRACRRFRACPNTSGFPEVQFQLQKIYGNAITFYGL